MHALYKTYPLPLIKTVWCYPCRAMSLDLTYHVGQPQVIPLSAHLQNKLVVSGHNVLLTTLQQDLHQESFGKHVKMLFFLLWTRFSSYFLPTPGITTSVLVDVTVDPYFY